MVLSEIQEMMESIKRSDGSSSRGLQSVESYLEQTSGLRKFKAASEESWKFLFPKQLRLPFDLFTGEKRPKSKPYVILKSVTTACKILAVSCKENDAVASALVKHSRGINFIIENLRKEFNDDSIDETNYKERLFEFKNDDICDTLWKVVSSFVSILHYSNFTYRINMPIYSDFAVNVLAKVEVEDGAVVRGDELYNYAVLSNEIGNIVVNNFKKSRENDPEWNKLNQQAKQQMISAERAKQEISLPRMLGFTIVSAYKIDSSGNLVTGQDKLTNNIANAVCRYKINLKDLKEEILKNLNSAYDIKKDYLEIDYDFGEEGAMGLADVYNGKKPNKNPLVKIASVVPDIDNQFQSYFDDSSHTDDSIIISSTREYQPPNVGAIVAAFSSSIKMNLLTKEMATRFKKEITQMNKSSDVAGLLMDDALPEGGEIKSMGKYIEDSDTEMPESDEVLEGLFSQVE